MIIKLVRHGQSKSNTGEIDISVNPDNKVGLTNHGIEQCMQAGSRIGSDFISSALLFRSPYIRTRETSLAIVAGSGLNPKNFKWIEDPLLREIDMGYKKINEQIEKRKTHGFFYYRFYNGESPADVYTRCSVFINAMMRKPKKNVLIVSHGQTIRVFIMRFMKLSIEEYTRMINPMNAEDFTICPINDLPKDVNVLFSNKKWALYGNMNFYNNETYDEDEFINKLNEFNKK